MQRLSLEQHGELLRAAERDGLYSPENERDACGMGFVAHIKGVKSHQILRDALQVLANLIHRGATGCDPCTGDGAGVMSQIPHKFFARVCKDIGIALPEPERYAVGMLFLPLDADKRARVYALIAEVIAREGMLLLGKREVPLDTTKIGELARESLPSIGQIFVAPGAAQKPGTDEFERKLFVLRRSLEDAVAAAGLGAADQFYVCSLSTPHDRLQGLDTPGSG